MPLGELKQAGIARRLMAKLKQFCKPDWAEIPPQ